MTKLALDTQANGALKSLTKVGVWICNKFVLDVLLCCLLFVDGADRERNYTRTLRSASRTPAS